MIRIGLDFHGVIDTHPKTFSDLSNRVISKGGEIHIITGAHIDSGFREHLIKLGIRWTHMYSITDYHLSMKTPMTFDDTGNPWIDKETWDRSKGDYCRVKGVDLHIDDSDIYGNYFDTPYIKIGEYVKNI